MKKIFKKIEERMDKFLQINQENDYVYIGHDSNYNENN